MTSPWGKIGGAPADVSFEDIMSEQLARELQLKEDEKFVSHANKGVPPDKLEEFGASSLLEEATACESDELIAAMLQRQFDREFDEELQRTEDKFNGASKVSVSYSNFKRSCDADSDAEEAEELPEKKDWDRFDEVEREFAAMPRCGYMHNHDGGVVTKHDITMGKRRNACKFMSSFPPEFQTGDGAGFDLQLSNRVFNSLRAHSRHEQSRRHRLHDKKEDQATAELGVDEATRLLLFKLINNQLLERVNGTISTGKEAVIIHADTDPTYPDGQLPKECVVKIFKTTLCEFKQRDKYIKDDYRFKDRYGKLNAKRTVHLWAEKEMHNLRRLRSVGIPCPEVVALKKHILVMSFIGQDHRPAPKLKDAIMDAAELILAYDQVVDTMKKLYSDANLVHADLSEYNILWHDGQCWFIDVSQAVEPCHPNAFVFLMRDCGNVITFFSRKGVEPIVTADSLFKEITGMAFDDPNLPEATAKVKPHHIDRPDMDIPCNFENLWNNSLNANSDVEPPVA